MKTTFVTTVFNEEKTIGSFLDSLFSQSVLPQEIIIVDAGSKDETVEISKEKISNFQKFNKRINVKVIVKQGNRSIGRNVAIEEANGDIIACSDAGCNLNKDWLRNITRPFFDKSVDVVSGFYKPITNSVFEKCLAAYTCVMPDRVDPGNFLPSSRSVAFKKRAWEKVHGYPEELDTCEDLVFANKLKKTGFKFYFEEKAIVYWPQRKNIKEAFVQFFNYAKGDGQALFFRRQTPLLFGRYLFVIIVLTLGILFQEKNTFYFLLTLLFIYAVWSIIKNYKYVKSLKAILILPALQITADIAVIAGTALGLVSRFR